MESNPAVSDRPHVVHLETGRHVYGGDQQVLYLTERLPALGVRCTLVCAAGGEMATKARAAGTDVVELSTIGDADPSITWRFASLLRRLQPDLVHIHSRRGADVWGGLGARLAGRCLCSRPRHRGDLGDGVGCVVEVNNHLVHDAFLPNAGKQN